MELLVGQTYPKTVEEGATVQFLQDKSNQLIIAIGHLNSRETKTLRSGEIHCGLLAQNGALVLLWQILDEKKKVLFTLESSFDDGRLAQLNLDQLLGSEQPIHLEVHIVDHHDKTIQGVRSMRFSSEFSTLFLLALKEQRSSEGESVKQYKRWLKQEPEALFQFSEQTMLVEV